MISRNGERQNSSIGLNNYSKAQAGQRAELVTARMATTEALGIKSLACDESAGYVAFFCIGEECKRHRIVEFTYKQLCELFKVLEVENQFDGQLIGLGVYCATCLDERVSRRILIEDLQCLIDVDTVNAVGMALCSRACKFLFIVEKREERKGEGTFSCLVCSADIFHDHKELFTGPVYEIDVESKKLVPADSETFFGLE